MYYSVSHQHCPAYIGDMVQSVATSIPTVKVRSPVFHMPNVRRRRTKNSYETWGACVLSFRTFGVKYTATASQYP